MTNLSGGWGVARSIRIAGRLVWLGLMSCAMALPLRAEEVTVTVPPDDPPAQAQPAAQSYDPTAHATDAASPQNSAQAEPPPSEPAPAAAAPAAEAPAAAEAAPAAPVVKKAHKKAKKAAAAPKENAAEADAGAPAAKPAEAAKKTKSAKASCLNLAEDACAANSACIWVAAGTNDAGKATKARCRSLAILKRETDKAAKAAKTKEPEVLPWAKNATTGSASAAPTATSATAAAETKPEKKKTVHHAKKTKPKPAAATPPADAASAAPAQAPAASDGGSAAPPAAGDVGGAD